MKTIQSFLRGPISILGICVVTACSSGDPSSTSELNWAACEDADDQFECTSLTVPMNYAEPDGLQVDLALIRLRATGDNRIGSLFVNFGGAAGRGVDDVQAIVEENILPNSLLQAYDIVGFNPRGSLGSSPVDCSDVADLDFNPYPTDAAAITELHADYVQFATACETKYGEYLQHLGSMNTVRDLEQIRMAMGDAQVNFLAYSFASRVAALYMQEFPESTGRMVLDGSLSPDSSLRTLLADPLSQTQAGLLSILAECQNTDPDCEPAALIDNLAQRLSTLAQDNSEASQFEFELVFLVLEAAIESPALGRFIALDLVYYINTSDIAIFEALVNSEDNGDDEDNGEPAEGDDGRTVDIATLCADDAFRPDIDSLVSELSELNNRSDVFAEVSLSELASCAGWPEALSPLAPITTNTAPASIVIGGSNDLIAPIGFSEEMAAAIGGVFISSDHEGHISVFLDKSDCVDTLVEEFLIDGSTPAVAECRQQ